MRSINDLVNDGLQRWLDVTGVDLTTRNYNTGNYQLRKYTEELSESRSMDPSGLTTFMMLRSLTEMYLKDITFTAYELILNPEAAEKKLASMRTLRDVLEDPQVLEMVKSFADQILAASIHYQKPIEQLPALEEMLQSKWSLAFLRRDALRSMERLEAHQFIQGNPEEASLKFNPEIFEFWNINSLLRAVRSQRTPGITLALIRDPEALFSFFVFAIRNGDTITVLTDRSKEVHPAYKRMSRRPDREYSERASRHWFPYELVGTEVNEDQKRLFVKARTSLVPINVDAVVLKKIGELAPEEFVWITLMFDLIRDKYGKRNHKLPEVSYTGEMVVEPHALVGEHGSLVKEGHYKPLQLAPLTKAVVTHETTAAQWGRAPTGQNRWMVERYGDQVPDEAFNVVGEESKTKLLEAHKDLYPIVKEWGTYGKDVVPQFEMLDPLNFGGAEKIKQDRVWAARVNQMTTIKRLAKTEFEATRGEIVKWVTDAMNKHQEFILTAAARGELKLPGFGIRSYGVEKELWEHDANFSMYNAISQVESPDGVAGASHDMRYINTKSGDVRFGEPDFSYKFSYCVDRIDVKATIFTSIRPQCPQGLAILCGVEVKDLPEVLQHWYKAEPYVGNCILDRIDPEDWILKNYWRDLSFRAWIAFSKHAFNARRKALGLPRKVWPDKKEETND